MRLNTRNIVWALLSILFIAGSIWIHYLVKIDMTHGDFGGATLFLEGDARYTAHEMEKLRALLEDLTIAHPFGGSAQI